MKYIFTIILVLAESFNTMNRPDLARPLLFSHCYFGKDSCVCSDPYTKYIQFFLNTSVRIERSSY